MSKNEVRMAFIKSISDLTDGTTIKVVKGEKTLIEIDGGLISGIMNVADKYDRLDTFETMLRNNSEME